MAAGGKSAGSGSQKIVDKARSCLASVMLALMLGWIVAVGLCSAEQIYFGNTICSSISQPAEEDEYLFSAVLGDKVLARMSRGSGSWYPSIQLHDPNGSLLCKDDLGNPTAEIENCDLLTSGTFRLTAYDYHGTGTGDYCVYVQRLNNPGSAAAISFEETKATSIDSPAEMDTYSFAAKGGSSVRVRASRSSGSWYPSIRLYGPDGTLLCEDELGNPTAEIENCPLPSDGKYSVLAYDYHGTGIGAYNFYLGCLTPPL